MNKKRIKRIVSPFIPRYVKDELLVMRRVYRNSHRGILYAMKNTKVVRPRAGNSDTGDYVRQFGIMVKAVKPIYRFGFVYPYCPEVYRIFQGTNKRICSITVDYETVLNSSLADISSMLSGSSDFENNERRLIGHIQSLVRRISNHLQDDSRQAQQKEYFGRMLDNKPQTFDEALQKILFYNALFWQMRHYHNGLGRLDHILEPYYRNDLERNVLDREGAKSLLCNFCKVLGNDTRFKSLSLYGDTGQYILLGGVGQDGKNVDNELTEIFLELFAEMKVPDPKLILRVNDKTSSAVWRKAIDSITTGCGSPLLMNEELIMRSMTQFGYHQEDVWNMGTSACWEPLIIGKSFDQNNPLRNISVIEALNQSLMAKSQYNSFDELLADCEANIKKLILDTVHDINFDCSPLYSLFFDDCLRRRMDYARGGAVYAYHGVQIVSFPNLINALLNFKTFVFEQEVFSYEECVEALRTNFQGHEEMLTALHNNPLCFGNTDSRVLDLCNRLMSFISSVVEGLTINGKKAKVGFSSSAYVGNGKAVKASFDGRRDCEPFAVHISPVSSKVDIQEIIDFAGALDYSGNRLNGNVVDFILPTAFVSQPDKLVAILRNAMSKGVFELQLNVLDAATLRDAKAHPEKYPNLVVRVWGFSAYFNELPDVYKDNLIKRAEAYA